MPLSPPSRLEFIQSISALLQSRAFVNPDFYQTPNLSAWLGSKSIEYFKIHSGQRVVLGIDNRMFSGRADLSIDVTPDIAKPQKAVLQLTMVDGQGPSFEELEYVFGKNWERAQTRFVPSLHGRLSASTHNMGNSTVLFQQQESRIIAELRGDGTALVLTVVTGD